MTLQENWNLDTHPGFIERQQAVGGADLVLIQDADHYPCPDDESYGWVIVYDGSKIGGHQHAGPCFIKRDEAKTNFDLACHDVNNKVWLHLVGATITDHGMTITN